MRNTCPFLGLKEDPSTALSFPSQGNFCHRARPVAPVKGDYQRQYCLTAEHTGCPIFQAMNPLPLPAAIAALPVSATNPRRILLTIGIPVLLAGTTALAFAFNVFGSRIGGESIPVTSMGLPGAWSVLGTNSPQFAPIIVPTTDPPKQAQSTECPLPSGWVPYTVNPTDTLYRLSVVYGVSVEQLQQINCLGNQTILSPGQVIYVPNIPTDTPFPTITPVPVYPTNTPIPPQQNNPPAPQANTPVPPQPAAQPTEQPAKPAVKPANNDNPNKQENNNKGGNKKGKNKDGKGKGKGGKGK